MKDPRWSNVERFVTTTRFDADGSKSITVDRFPVCVAVSIDLLAQVDPSTLRHGAGWVYVAVSNGWARYLVVDQRDDELLCLIKEAVARLPEKKG